MYLDDSKFRSLMVSVKKKIIEHRMPDAVFGVPRGGLVPAVHISNEFGLPMPLTIEDAEQYNLLLVIDDICDTGDTFSLIRHLRSKPRLETMFYALVSKPHCQFRDAFTFMSVPDEVWVRFPWEPKAKTNTVDRTEIK